MDTESGFRSSDRSMRLVAGSSLLVMAVLAGWANFAVFESKIVDGDAAATVVNIVESETLFRLGVLAFLVVGVLDLIVAWSLNEVVRHRAPQLSMLAAAFRYVYGGILIVATGFLAIGADIATKDVANVDTAALQTWLDGYAYTWDIGLAIFALHLILLGYAIQKADLAGAWVGLGWIVLVAGLGYLIDAVAVVLAWDFGFEFGAIFFVGEVLLLVWLLVTGFRTRK